MFNRDLRNHKDSKSATNPDANYQPLKQSFSRNLPILTLATNSFKFCLVGSLKEVELLKCYQSLNQFKCDMEKNVKPSDHDQFNVVKSRSVLSNQFNVVKSRSAFRKKIGRPLRRF